MSCKIGERENFLRMFIHLIKFTITMAQKGILVSQIWEFSFKITSKGRELFFRKLTGKEKGLGTKNGPFLLLSRRNNTPTQNFLLKKHTNTHQKS